ncbi:MAG TPA: hypothetical protein VNJ01_01380 [Bacteriovoracaceae bacterium]|nr:hypothetical protein [Bacteriovoracaceae bacterium]
MAGHHDNDKLRKKVNTKLPQVFVDKDADFASIKIAEGIEAKSYMKDGFVFSEDKKGNIIEVQILNLSEIKKSKKKSA